VSSGFSLPILAIKSYLMTLVKKNSIGELLTPLKTSPVSELALKKSRPIPKKILTFYYHPINMGWCYSLTSPYLWFVKRKRCNLIRWVFQKACSVLRLVDRWFSAASFKCFISAFIALDPSYYKVAMKLHYKVRTVQRHGPFLFGYYRGDE
jgi:hypothetical protein